MPIRITGGILRGRNIPSPDSNKTRPTASRTREALFNILQSVENFKILDLFAGTGIMGIEAVSRGAAHVVAVEKNQAQARLLYKAYQSVGIADKLTLIEKNALSLSEYIDENQQFDLIYADPPFKEMDYPNLEFCYNYLKPGGVAVFEAPSKKIPLWAKELKMRKYGESTLLFFKR